MSKNNSYLPTLLFVLVAVLDGGYVFLIRSEPSIAIHAWFVIWPLISFFYFTFTLFAALGLYQRVTLGYSLAYAVLLFGMIAISISYALTYRGHVLIEIAFECLLAISIFLLAYLAINQKEDSSR